MKTRINENLEMLTMFNDIDTELKKYETPTIDIIEVNELILPAEVLVAAVGAAAAVVGSHIANKMMG